VEAKRLLARTVVDLYGEEGAGAAAEAEFDRVFKRHDAPSEIPQRSIPAADFPMRLASALHAAGLVKSNKDGRRMIEQDAVQVDGVRVDDPELEVDAAAVDGRILQVGKRQWARVVVT
jgi:tyrosyl-tRNA synthetase